MDFSQFLSDVIATMVGAGLALWSAIWLDRRTSKRDEKKRSDDKRDRGQKVLSLLKTELEFDLEALKHIDDNLPSTFRQLRTESWQALSDGGELTPIDDPQLLATISNAYADVTHFGVLYDKFFDLTFFPEKNAYQSLKPVFINHAMGAKEKAKESVGNALKQIEDKFRMKSTGAAT